MANYLQSGAVIDKSRRYRYALWRRWNEEGPIVGYIMLNPSTADGMKDDPTIRRCVEFAKFWGYSGIAVCNLFALRSPSPQVLSYDKDPIGPRNADYLSKLTENAGMIIAAWGAHEAAVERARQFTSALPNDIRLFCLGFSNSGAPRHPLYIPSGTIPILFWPESVADIDPPILSDAGCR